MFNIPSFKLFKIQDSYSIENIKESNIIENIELKPDDSKTTRIFLESAKRLHRDLYFENSGIKDTLKFKFEELFQFNNDQTVWIQKEKIITRF